MISRIDRRPRKNGKVSWRVRVWCGYDAAGKPIKDSKTFHTKGEAEEYVTELNSARRAGPVATVLQLGEYLDQWLATIKATREYYTFRRYSTLVKPVREALGDVRLDKLTATELERVYAALYDDHSATSVRHAHGAIRSALNRAVKLKLIPHNPALACSLRAADTRESRIIEQADMEKLEAAAGGKWITVVIRLAMDTGARRGELCGFRWQDLSEEGKLRIWQSVGQDDDGHTFVKPTKTRSERRVQLSPDTLAYLDLHRERQRQEAALFGPDYRRDLDLILAAPDGYYLKPQTLTMTVRRLARRAGLKGVGLHTLRHSHASIMLANGAPLAAVSKRLGHRDTHTTARVYSHALPSDEEKLADLWDAIKRGEGRPKMGKFGEPAPGQDKTGHQKPN